MTELRYLPDADDVLSFSATVEEATEEYMILNGTYFYPEGGGQPADHGTIEWADGRAEVVGAKKNHKDVRHQIGSLSGDLPANGTSVEGQVDEQRRRDHRRMHTAQHVISRVVLDEYGATTAGNQVYAGGSRIDFEPADFDDDDVALIEQRANDVVQRDLTVNKEHRPRDEVEATVDEGRALLDLIPDHVDPLRVVEIEDYDMCPCGGTHVDSLGEIGRIDITNCESKGADTVRVEFELQTG